MPCPVVLYAVCTFSCLLCCLFECMDHMLFALLHCLFSHNHPEDTEFWCTVYSIYGWDDNKENLNLKTLMNKYILAPLPSSLQLSLPLLPLSVSVSSSLSPSCIAVINYNWTLFLWYLWIPDLSVLQMLLMKRETRERKCEWGHVGVVGFVLAITSFEK